MIIERTGCPDATAGGSGGFGLGFDLGPAIAQGDGQVEHQVLGGGVRVDAEKTLALELEDGSRRGARQAGFDLAAGEHLQRIGVEIIEEGLAFFRLYWGSGTVNRRSYMRTSASRACWADTQWMVPRTLRPSGA